jgi:hypothetical protein
MRLCQDSCQSTEPQLWRKLWRDRASRSEKKKTLEGFNKSVLSFCLHSLQPARAVFAFSTTKEVSAMTSTKLKQKGGNNEGAGLCRPPAKTRTDRPKKDRALQLTRNKFKHPTGPAYQARMHQEVLVLFQPCLFAACALFDTQYTCAEQGKGATSF